MQHKKEVKIMSNTKECFFKKIGKCQKASCSWDAYKDTSSERWRGNVSCEEGQEMAKADKHPVNDMAPVAIAMPAVSRGISA